MTAAVKDANSPPNPGTILKPSTSTSNDSIKSTPETSSTTTPIPKIKRYRDPLSPKPILDRHLLIKELEKRSITLKDGQMDTFYQLMHRQHYPSLPDFVEEYYRIDASNRNNNKEDAEEIQNLPLKNRIAKNKNTRQLPKAFLEFLSSPDSDFVTLTTKVQTQNTSLDGTTTKLGVELQDGHVVESVLMRHVSPEGSRATLCVSSQVGCAMGCTFCATGTMGIRGNLTSGEILEQLVHAGKILAAETLEQQQNNNSSNNNKPVTALTPKSNSNGGVRDKTRATTQKIKNNTPQLSLVRNIVFMGMGEPLNNYKNVLESCRGMLDRKRWNLSAKHVTVSTVGVIPKMKSLTKDLPEVSLALSLHAPNQKMRTDIVPTAKNYPIEGLIQALDDHMMAMTKITNDNDKRRKRRSVESDGGGGNDEKCEEKRVYNAEQRKAASKRKRAMIEYVMLKGDTSTFECAHQLGKLCENRLLIVNLIPYNQTDVKDKLSCPSEEHMREFQRIVTSYGVFCFIRRTMGADIAGACGQLVVEQESKKISGASSAVAGGNEKIKSSLDDVDIEDGPFVAGKKNGASTSSSVVIGREQRRVKRSIGSSSSSSLAQSNESRKATTDEDEKATKDISNDNIDNDANGNGYDIEKWVRPLAIATGVSASCFIISSILFLLQRSHHRRR